MSQPNRNNNFAERDGTGPVFTRPEELQVPKDLIANQTKEVESDQRRLEVRMKQIQFGKNTIGYDNYLATVAKENRKRCPEHPVTPDINEKVSKRQFDGRIHVWRRALHEWDNVDQLPIPDSKPRQKRKADSMSLETADTKPSSTSSDDISSKRRKVENQPLEHKISNPSVLHVPSAKEEDNNDHQNTFAIGENEDDGYISEDVL